MPVHPAFNAKQRKHAPVRQSVRLMLTASQFSGRATGDVDSPILSVPGNQATPAYPAFSYSDTAHSCYLLLLHPHEVLRSVVFVGPLVGSYVR